jgi:hypothetical protein
VQQTVDHRITSLVLVTVSGRLLQQNLPEEDIHGTLDAGDTSQNCARIVCGVLAAPSYVLIGADKHQVRSIEITHRRVRYIKNVKRRAASVSGFSQIAAACWLWSEAQ